MVLKKESPRPAWVVNHFVHALPELRIPMLLGHELRTHPDIPGTPASTAIV
jgi:hypothetical protein